ncbi:MAG: DEAD/DEAH box helicase family protein [Cyanothece sp. SIO2G6]|nr:DEAD/DEAH box helicase family protein [Cyanothece sp. SIO2G6]
MRGSVHLQSVDGTMIQLYDYQAQMVQETYQTLKQGVQTALIIAVMGAGKTITSAWIMRDCVRKQGRVLFLVSFTCLIDQTLETLALLDVSATALQGKRRLDPNAPVVVASIQTISKRLSQGLTLDQLFGPEPFRLIVADEAHLLAFDQVYQVVVTHYSKATQLGLTATPWRLSKQEWMGQKYQRAIVGPQPTEIIKRGKALPCRGFQVEGMFELDSLDIQAGDYAEPQMTQIATRPEALDQVIDEWQRISGDRPTLMVGAGVKQAVKQAERFNQRGFPAAVIHGGTSKTKRTDIFNAVGRGDLQVICSVGCLTAGFNLPPLASILYIRATKSKALFHQTGGRAARIHPGKTDYHLLDFGGNLHRHGDPMGEQDYNIWGDSDGGSDWEMVKLCPDCQNKVNIFLARCTSCGYLFSEHTEDDETLDQLDLLKLTEYFDEPTAQKFNEIRQWRRRAWRDNLSPDKPIEHFQATYGYIPPDEWFKGATAVARSQYVNYLDRHSKRGRWADNWIQYHLHLEFGP